MTDLERFRDHCRRMAETDPNPLWILLADEVDAYLAADEVDVELGFEL